MRELPEPKIDVKLPNMFGQDVEVIETFTRGQVLAIQRQAYEDGLRDALEAVNTTILPVTLQAGMDGMARIAKEECADSVRDLLTASQKPRCELCGYQHGHAIGCANNPVDIALKAASQKEAE